VQRRLAIAGRRSCFVVGDANPAAASRLLLT
jgi:hypothetical protein